MFNKLINDHVGNYSSYVVMPANLKNTEQIIDRLPQDKVYILDQTLDELKKYPSVFQNFKKDIYQSLEAALKQIGTYKNMVLLYSAARRPQGILDGFNLFCSHHNIQNEVIEKLINRELLEGELYIILDDKNLIRIIKRIKEQGLTIAKAIGLICYNDALLKEIVEGSIRTISTDFNLMGQRLAKMILDKEFVQVENANRLIMRNSI